MNSPVRPEQFDGVTTDQWTVLFDGRCESSYYHVKARKSLNSAETFRLVCQHGAAWVKTTNKRELRRELVEHEALSEEVCDVLSQTEATYESLHFRQNAKCNRNSERGFGIGIVSQPKCTVVSPKSQGRCYINIFKDDSCCSGSSWLTITVRVSFETHIPESMVMSSQALGVEMTTGRQVPLIEQHMVSMTRPVYFDPNGNLPTRPWTPVWNMVVRRDDNTGKEFLQWHPVATRQPLDIVLAVMWQATPRDVRVHSGIVHLGEPHPRSVAALQTTTAAAAASSATSSRVPMAAAPRSRRRATKRRHLMVCDNLVDGEGNDESSSDTSAHDGSSSSPSFSTCSPPSISSPPLPPLPYVPPALTTSQVNYGPPARHALENVKQFSLIVVRNATDLNKDQVRTLILRLAYSGFHLHVVSPSGPPSYVVEALSQHSSSCCWQTTGLADGQMPSLALLSQALALLSNQDQEREPHIDDQLLVVTWGEDTTNSTVSLDSDRLSHTGPEFESASQRVRHYMLDESLSVGALLDVLAGNRGRCRRRWHHCLLAVASGTASTSPRAGRPGETWGAGTPSFNPHRGCLSDLFHCDDQLESLRERVFERDAYLVMIAPDLVSRMVDSFIPEKWLTATGLARENQVPLVSATIARHKGTREPDELADCVFYF